MTNKTAKEQPQSEVALSSPLFIIRNNTKVKMLDYETSLGTVKTAQDNERLCRFIDKLNANGHSLSLRHGFDYGEDGACAHAITVVDEGNGGIIAAKADDPLDVIGQLEWRYGAHPRLELRYVERVP